jgi:hypothetical protein
MFGKAHCHDAKSASLKKYLVFFYTSIYKYIPRLEDRMLPFLFIGGTVLYGIISSVS